MSSSKTNVAIVTGASRGIGAVIARQLANEGFAVVINYANSAGEATELVAELRESGHRAIAVKADVANAADVKRLFDETEQQLGKVDVLINNAGLALGTEPAQVASLDEWETMIETNNKGLVAMTRAVLPDMVARKSGLIINIGSVAGLTAYPGGNVYGATKAFVYQFTRNLCADLAGTGVRASTIAPGLCGGTEFSNVRYRGDDEAAAKVYEGSEPLTAEDVAESAYWIATQPPHVTIVSMEMLPNCQGYAGFNVKRDLVG